MELRVLLDMQACAQQMVNLIRRARTCIFYSEFVTQLHTSLPGHTVTLATLFKEALTRGVRVCMFVNPTEQYGNSMHELTTIDGLHACFVKSDGYIPSPFKSIFGERYTNHHQKFLLVDDDTIMIGGVGVHPCRAGWLVLNGEAEPYYWHEIGISMPCSAEMAAWVRAQWDGNYTVPLPVPFLAGATEHNIILHLIRTARSCIHLEAQLCISTASTSNQVLATVVERVRQAYHNTGDGFHFIMLVNTHQPDEHKLVSTATTATLHWSRRMMMNLAQARGVPETFMAERVFIGTLEYNGVHIKVHSNLLIQDGHTMIRSSSNLTDRSLSPTPCDNELGVLVRDAAVADVQQILWARYFNLPSAGPWTPAEAFHLMTRETGCVRTVRYYKHRDTCLLPDSVADFVMRAIHKLPYFGSTRKINWSNDSVY